MGSFTDSKECRCSVRQSSPVRIAPSIHTVGRRASTGIALDYRFIRNTFACIRCTLPLFVMHKIQSGIFITTKFHIGHYIFACSKTSSDSWANCKASPICYSIRPFIFGRFIRDLAVFVSSNRCSRTRVICICINLLITRGVSRICEGGFPD